LSNVGAVTLNQKGKFDQVIVYHDLPSEIINAFF
jgi:hypothetical protein